MSDESAPTAKIEALPEKITTKATFTFDFPNILLGIGKDANGFVARQIREGEARQVEFTTEIEYSDTVPPEEEVFAFRALNRIRFGGSMISVLNDAISLEGLELPASAPSTQEYLDLIGQPVVIRYACQRDKVLSARRGEPTYRIARTKVTLL